LRGKPGLSSKNTEHPPPPRITGNHCYAIRRIGGGVKGSPSGRDCRLPTTLTVQRRHGLALGLTCSGRGSCKGRREKAIKTIFLWPRSSSARLLLYLTLFQFSFFQGFFTQPTSSHNTGFLFTPYMSIASTQHFRPPSNQILFVVLSSSRHLFLTTSTVWPPSHRQHLLSSTRLSSRRPIINTVKPTTHSRHFFL